MLAFYAKRTVQSEGWTVVAWRGEKGGGPPHPPGTAENAGSDVIMGWEYKRETRGMGGHIAFSEMFRSRGMRVRSWPHCFICLDLWKRERIGPNVTRMVTPSQRPCCGAYIHDQCLVVHWMTTQPTPVCPWCGKRLNATRNP